MLVRSLAQTALLPLLLPPPSRGPSLRACDDGWNFVEVRKAGWPEPPPLVVDAVQSPFGTPLFIGPPQEQPVLPEPEAYEALARAERDRAPVVHIPDRRLNFRKAAGTVAVVARVVALSSGRSGDLASVKLAGIGRCEILGLESGRGGAVSLRVRPWRDTALSGERLARANELSDEVRALWAEVSERHRVLQNAKLQARRRALPLPPLPLAAAAVPTCPAPSCCALRRASCGGHVLVCACPSGQAEEARGRRERCDAGDPRGAAARAQAEHGG